MKFTFVMFGGALSLIVIAYNLFGVGILTTIGGFWLLISVPMVSYYWIARIVRMAWNHGRQENEVSSLNR